MKRTPLIANLILFVTLCASLTYWAIQFFQPAPRPVVAPPVAPVQAAELSSAANLFGGTAISSASNLQLTGIILADHPKQSIAIISSDGKPAHSYRVNSLLSGGGRVTEVQRDYVVVEQNGAPQKLILPAAKK